MRVVASEKGELKNMVIMSMTVVERYSCNFLLRADSGGIFRTWKEANTA